MGRLARFMALYTHSSFLNVHFFLFNYQHPLPATKLKFQYFFIRLSTNENAFVHKLSHMKIKKSAKSIKNHQKISCFFAVSLIPHTLPANFTRKSYEHNH